MLEEDYKGFQLRPSVGTVETGMKKGQGKLAPAILSRLQWEITLVRNRPHPPHDHQVIELC